MRFAICFTLASITPALPALAQNPAGVSTSPPSLAINMDLATTDAIRTMLGTDFDEGQIAMLQALGHQQAVASSCPGFTIDERLFASEMDLIYDDKKGKPRPLSGSQRVALERKATLAFGTALGAQIAIAAQDRQGFCQAAQAERAGGKIGHLVWAK